MVEATLTSNLEINDPTCEVVILTFSDGYTYTSKKFGSVLGGLATFNEDTETLTYPVSLAISGGIVTLHCEGVSSKKICLVLYGTK